MRHNVAGRKLARTSAHRLALRRNVVQSLFEHGQIRTTIVKAKEFRRFAERLIHLAVKAAIATAEGAKGGDDERAQARITVLAYRQQAEALLTDRAIIRPDNRKDYDAMSDSDRNKVMRSRSGRRYRAATTRPGVAFTAESVIHKLFNDIGPRMYRRGVRVGTFGGYIRIIKLAERRLGDAGQLAIMQIVAEDDAKREKLPDTSQRRRRAKVRYAVYAGKPRNPRAPSRSRKAAAPASE